MSFKNAHTSAYNQMKTAYPQIEWQAALGYNPELSFIRKFGRNTAVGSGVWEDVWDYGGDYNWPSDSGDAMWISSSNAADTQDIVVQGLDENFLMKEETIALQGQTFVALSGLWSRVHRAYNDSSTNLAGIVYISSDNTDAGGDGVPDVTTAIHATVNAAENQTLQALYTVASNFRLLLTGARFNLLSVAGATTKQAKFTIDVREFGKVWRTQGTTGLTTVGSSVLELALSIPSPIKPASDIRVQANGIGAAVDVDATFTGILLGI